MLRAVVGSWPETQLLCTKSSAGATSVAQSGNKTRADQNRENVEQLVKQGDVSQLYCVEERERGLDFPL